MEFWIENNMEMENGRTFKIKAFKQLDSIKTQYQHICVFETQSYGKVLSLDGTVVMTELDEFCYHEMIAHVPILCHPSPEQVLVIGGGSGGIVREVLKHKTIREVHLPDMAQAMSDPRVIHVYQNGAQYVKRHEGIFDVVIVDFFDLIKHGKTLLQEPFYRAIHGALRETGICVTQAENFFYHGEIIKTLFEFIPKIYSEYGYYYTNIPSYLSGIIGFAFLSNKINPYKINIDSKRIPPDLKYYSVDIHKAAFVLPEFANKYIKRS